MKNNVSHFSIHRFTRLLVYSFTLFLVACTNRPSHVLSEKKMEDVLFDFYVAEAEIKENSAVFYSDSSQKTVFQAVFKKHRISEQKFDTSLVWYNAHLDKYMKINEKLTERYTILIGKLHLEASQIRMPKNRLQFSELGLKDFAASVLFSSIQLNDSNVFRNDTLLP